MSAFAIFSSFDFLSLVRSLFLRVQTENPKGRFGKNWREKEFESILGFFFFFLFLSFYLFFYDDVVGCFVGIIEHFFG